MAGYVAQAAREDWRTPEAVVELLHLLWDGPPDLDPCSGPGSIVQARRRIEPPDDGLAETWPGRVFVNPPFGELSRWAAKCVEEKRQRGAEVVLLLPSRTDTRYWHAHVRRAQAICFWRGRLKFLGAPAAAPFPVALAYFGPRPWAFQQVFSAKGMVVAP